MTSPTTPPDFEGMRYMKLFTEYSAENKCYHYEVYRILRHVLQTRLPFLDEILLHQPFQEHIVDFPYFLGVTPDVMKLLIWWAYSGTLYCTDDDTTIQIPDSGTVVHLYALTSKIGCCTLQNDIINFFSYQFQKYGVNFNLIPIIWHATAEVSSKNHCSLRNWIWDQCILFNAPIEFHQRAGYPQEFLAVLLHRLILLKRGQYQPGGCMYDGNMGYYVVPGPIPPGNEPYPGRFSSKALNSNEPSPSDEMVEPEVATPVTLPSNNDKAQEPSEGLAVRVADIVISMPTSTSTVSPSDKNYLVDGKHAEVSIESSAITTPIIEPSDSAPVSHEDPPHQILELKPTEAYVQQVTPEHGNPDNVNGQNSVTSTVVEKKIRETTKPYHPPHGRGLIALETTGHNTKQSVLVAQKSSEIPQLVSMENSEAAIVVFIHNHDAETEFEKDGFAAKGHWSGLEPSPPLQHASTPSFAKSEVPITSPIVTPKQKPVLSTSSWADDVEEEEEESEKLVKKASLFPTQASSKVGSVSKKKDGKKQTKNASGLNTSVLLAKLKPIQSEICPHKLLRLECPHGKNCKLKEICIHFSKNGCSLDNCKHAHVVGGCRAAMEQHKGSLSAKCRKKGKDHLEQIAHKGQGSTQVERELDWRSRCASFQLLKAHEDSPSCDWS